MAAYSRGPQVAAVTYTLVIISTIATLLRLYCRIWVVKAFATDDWLAAIAQVLFIVFSVYEIVGVHFGTGQHNAIIPTGQVHKAMQMWWTCEPLYVLTNMAIKASIGIFLLRICVHRVHKIIIWSVIGITEIYSVFFFLLFVLQCRPTSLFWLRYTENPPSGKCLDASVVANAFYGYSAISCMTDWTFSILPIFLVWNLQMNRRVKISVVLILAAGAIASSATIVRFPYLHTLTDINDFLYSTVDVAIWSTVETGIGITAAAVATLRPLLRLFGKGSSAPGHGTSARHWHRTGSGVNAAGAFELADQGGKRIGVTTVIDYDGDNDRAGLEDQKFNNDNGSEVSDSVVRIDNWNNSQTNLADRSEDQNTGTGWNIAVKKSVVQTRQVEQL